MPYGSAWWNRLHKVSVVIPAYNAQKFVRTTIDSVLNQTYPNYEVIVVDDSSTDNTQEILKSYGNRIRWISQSHRGASAARNTGIRSSNGIYIAFLDADDAWLPQKLEEQVRLLDEHPEFGLVYSNVEYPSKENGFKLNHFVYKRPYSGKVLEKLIAGNCIPTSSVVVRRECFDKVGLFDESLTVSEDHDMWLRIASCYDISYTEKTLVTTRFFMGSLSRDEIRLQKGNLAVLAKAKRTRIILAHVDRVIIDKTYNRILKRLGMLYVRQGMMGPAKVCLHKFITRSSREVDGYLMLMIAYLPGSFVLRCLDLSRSLIAHCSVIKYSIYGRLFSYDPDWCRMSERLFVFDA